MNTSNPSVKTSYSIKRTSSRSTRLLYNLSTELLCLRPSCDGNCQSHSILTPKIPNKPSLFPSFKKSSAQNFPKEGPVN